MSSRVNAARWSHPRCQAVNDALKLAPGILVNRPDGVNLRVDLVNRVDVHGRRCSVALGSVHRAQEDATVEDTGRTGGDDRAAPWRCIPGSEARWGVSESVTVLTDVEAIKTKPFEWLLKRKNPGATPPPRAGKLRTRTKQPLQRRRYEPT